MARSDSCRARQSTGMQRVAKIKRESGREARSTTQPITNATKTRFTSPLKILRNSNETCSCNWARQSVPTRLVQLYVGLVTRLRSYLTLFHPYRMGPTAVIASGGSLPCQLQRINAGCILGLLRLLAILLSMLSYSWLGRRPRVRRGAVQNYRWEIIREQERSLRKAICLSQKKRKAIQQQFYVGVGFSMMKSSRKLEH